MCSSDLVQVVEDDHLRTWTSSLGNGGDHRRVQPLSTPRRATTVRRGLETPLFEVRRRSRARISARPAKAVDPDREGHRVLALPAGTPPHNRSISLSTRRDRPCHRRLPDPRLAGQEHETPIAHEGSPERGPDTTEHVIPADQHVNDRTAQAASRFGAEPVPSGHQAHATPNDGSGSPTPPPGRPVRPGVQSGSAQAVTQR